MSNKLGSRAPRIFNAIPKLSRSKLFCGLLFASAVVLSAKELPTLAPSQSEAISAQGYDQQRGGTQTVPAERINFGMSLTLECPAANKGHSLFSMTNQAYRPLQLASRSAGADENSYIFMGTRAEGAQQTDPPEKGMLFSASSDGSYSLFGFNTVYAPDGPEVQFDPLYSVTRVELADTFSYLYAGLNATIDLDESRPADRQLLFSVSCDNRVA